MKTEYVERSETGWKVGRPYVNTSGVWSPVKEIHVKKGSGWVKSGIKKSSMKEDLPPQKFQSGINTGQTYKDFLHPDKMEGNIPVTYETLWNGGQLKFPEGDYIFYLDFDLTVDHRRATSSLYGLSPRGLVCYKLDPFSGKFSFRDEIGSLYFAMHTFRDNHTYYGRATLRAFTMELCSSLFVSVYT